MDARSWRTDRKLVLGANNMKRLITACIVSVSTFAFAQSEDVPDRADGEGIGQFERLVLRGAYLIDGTGAPPQGPVDIVIEKDRITEIKVVGLSDGGCSSPAPGVGGGGGSSAQPTRHMEAPNCRGLSQGMPAPFSQTPLRSGTPSAVREVVVASSVEATVCVWAVTAGRDNVATTAAAAIPLSVR